MVLWLIRVTVICKFCILGHVYLRMALFKAIPGINVLTLIRWCFPRTIMERIHFTHLRPKFDLFSCWHLPEVYNLSFLPYTEVPYWGMSWLRWIQWTLISTDWQGLNQITLRTRYIYNLNKQHTFTNDLLRAYIIIISKSVITLLLIVYIHHKGVSQ